MERFSRAAMQRFATSETEIHMVESRSAASKRAVLSSLTAAPITILGEIKEASRCDPFFAALPHPSTHPQLKLRRSRKGRSDSRFRYHNAESFFFGVEKGIVRDPHDRLYQIGIVLQLGLSSHLLDVGFTDQWCVRHIGLDVTRSLACANATGFGFESSDFDQLAAILSPYGKWRLPQSLESSTEIPFTAVQLLKLTRTLLDHVRQVTGHSRPRGKRA